MALFAGTNDSNMLKTLLPSITALFFVIMVIQAADVDTKLGEWVEYALKLWAVPIRPRVSRFYLVCLLSPPFESPLLSRQLYVLVAQAAADFTDTFLLMF